MESKWPVLPRASRLIDLDNLEECKDDLLSVIWIYKIK